MQVMAIIADSTRTQIGLMPDSLTSQRPKGDLMTDHYKEATRLEEIFKEQLRKFMEPAAWDPARIEPGVWSHLNTILAQAQIHATLATDGTVRSQIYAHAQFNDRLAHAEP